MSSQRARTDYLPAQKPPIRYLTENGFGIVRLSEIDRSTIDGPGQCRFLVQHEDEAEREIRVSFDESIVASLRLRRRNPLTENSLFWLVCAESSLAKYLWENDQYPPEGKLVINDLSPDELMLALHWQDEH